LKTGLTRLAALRMGVEEYLANAHRRVVARVEKGRGYHEVTVIADSTRLHPRRPSV